MALNNRPRIVVTTLCGSTRFKREFEMAHARLSLEGEAIFTCGLFAHADGIELMHSEKVLLDRLHLQKIHLSDGIYVINVGGYIGESTQREIEYALAHNKQIRYLEPVQRSKSDDQPTFEYDDDDSSVGKYLDHHLGART